MEQQLPTENESLFELRVDYDSGNRFKETSKWGRFVAIVYFIVIGLCLLGLTFLGSAMIGVFSQVSPLFASAGGTLVIICLIVAAVYVYVTIQLFRFASLVKDAIERQDQVTFNNALKALRNYMLVSGVISIIMILYSLYDTITSLF